MGMRLVNQEIFCSISSSVAATSGPRGPWLLSGQQGLDIQGKGIVLDDPFEGSVAGARVRINKCHGATPVNSRRGEGGILWLGYRVEWFALEVED